MIFPILRGLLTPKMAPLTYLFLFLNLLVFVVTADQVDDVNDKMDQILTDSRFMETQGSAFAYMIHHSGKLKIFSPMLVNLAENARKGDSQSKRALASLAIRNNDFMEKAENYKFGGDTVALGDWKKNFHHILELEESHPSYQWGLSRLRPGWMQYVTYQFSHGEFMHLFWNMVFLVIFGSFIEVELGSSIFALTLIGGGLLGGISYAFLSGISSSPLVGASAGVSALMALVGFHWMKKEKVRFFYWLLPLRGYFGFAKLSSGLVLLISMLPDLSGTLGASADFGAVAYTAHMGGALMGLLMSFMIRRGIVVTEPRQAMVTAKSLRP